MAIGRLLGQRKELASLRSTLPHMKVRPQCHVSRHLIENSPHCTYCIQCLLSDLHHQLSSVPHIKSYHTPHDSRHNIYVLIKAFKKIYHVVNALFFITSSFKYSSHESLTIPSILGFRILEERNLLCVNVSIYLQSCPC